MHFPSFCIWAAYISTPISLPFSLSSAKKWLSSFFLCALLWGRGMKKKEILSYVKRRAEIILLLPPSPQLTGARRTERRDFFLPFSSSVGMRSSVLPPPPSSSFFLVLRPRTKFQGCLTFQVITRTRDEVLLRSSSLDPLSSLSDATFSYCCIGN